MSRLTINLYEDPQEGGAFVQADDGPTYQLFDTHRWDSRFDVDAPAWLEGSWSPDDDYYRRDWESRDGGTSGLRLVAKWTASNGLLVITEYPNSSAAGYLGVESSADRADAEQAMLDQAIDDIEALGDWPGNPRHARDVDSNRLRAEIFDAIAARSQDLSVCAEARDLADEALAAGRYERIPDRPEQMPTYEDQTPGVGWWQWSPKDIWHYGPDEQFWPGPQTPNEHRWLTERNRIRGRYMNDAARERCRAIVPLPDLGEQIARAP